MKTILFGALAIAFAAALTIILLVIKIDVADIMFSMLAGTLVGVVSAYLALARFNTGRVPMFQVPIAVAGSALGWLFGLICLKVVGVDLYSSTALAYDLLTGLVGAATANLVMLQRGNQQAPIG